MNLFYEQISFKKKLIFMTVLPVLVVAMIFLVFITLAQANQKRDEQIDRAETLVRVVAGNLGPSALFRDRQSAADILQSMALEPRVVYARLEIKEFAVEEGFGNSLDDPSQLALDPQFQVERFSVWSSFLVSRTPVKVDNEAIGELVLITDTSQLKQSLIDQTLLILVLALVSAMVAYLFIRHFYPYITAPIMALRDSMRHVSKNNDYSVRIGEHKEPVMSDLYQGFNYMLDQIEHRDQLLSMHHGSLEKQIAQRHAEIESMQRKRIVWLENMAYFLKHELRNKIIGFNSSLDMIERRCTTEDVAKYLGRARISTTLMNHLLASVGKASDFEATLWSESKSVVNISLLFKDQLEEYRQIHPERSFTDEIETEIRVIANTPRLLQACDKLVSNALEHSRDGSDIFFQVQKDTHNAMLIIENRGDKLPEDLDVIFDIFVSTHSRELHRGMGLFVVKQIAENHGGDIFAEPIKNGSGARFTLKIPLFVTSKMKSR